MAAQLSRYADQRVKCDRSDCSDRRSCRVRSLMQDFWERTMHID
ncbi:MULTISPECIES: hypothetical protein [Microcystis]|nr:MULTISPECIES: hypothetical protein [Microcystis]MDB9387130.1 hypothetical protein [Microcystis aeruginosa CS-583]